MKKLLLFICLVTAWFGCFAQTGAKPDWTRSPNGFNTLVDYQLKVKYGLNVPHYPLASRPTIQDSIGSFLLNTTNGHPEMKVTAGSVYQPLALLDDTINYHFLPSSYTNGFYSTGNSFPGHFGINIANSSSVFGANAFVRVTQNNGWLAQMSAASSGFVGSGSLLQPNTVFFSGISPSTYVGNIDSLGKFSIFAGMDYSTRQVTIQIDSLRNIYFFHLGNSSVGGDSVLYIGVNGQLKKGAFHGVNSTFGRNGNVVAQSGDYFTNQVPEAGGVLYFTNARVLATPGTGFSAAAGTISATDPLITILNKLAGNIAASVTGVSSVNGKVGAVSITTADVNSAAATVLGTVTAGSFPIANLSGSYPTFNQNTTGSAATLTTPRAINSVNFDGSAPITITANTPGSLNNGYAIIGSPFSGANQTWKVDTTKVSTILGVIDTINAHGASAGYGVNTGLFATGTVAVDTTNVGSKAWALSAFYTKNQILTNNFVFSSLHAYKDSTSSTTKTPQLALDNNFIASATTDLFSPALRLRANRFSGTSQTSDFLLFHEVNDNTAIDQVVLAYSFGGASPSNIFSIDRFGNFNIIGAGNLSLNTVGTHILIAEGSGGYKGQATLVAGTLAITITGLTSSNRAFISEVSQGGTTSTTQSYTGACSTNTLTLKAVTNAGTNTINTADTSIINYVIF